MAHCMDGTRMDGTPESYKDGDELGVLLVAELGPAWGVRRSCTGHVEEKVDGDTLRLDEGLLDGEMLGLPLGFDEGAKDGEALGFEEGIYRIVTRLTRCLGLTKAI
jgi:hypothetical protein